MLEEMASDASLKATQRLRALEELGRIEARRSAPKGPAVEQEDEAAPDPMADLDEMEAARRRRASGGSAARRRAAGA
jgi:hypothetical protein